ncbi:MAG: hypothetical protein OXQ89_06075 [Rhodospirillaceae bacterium]|nr:hypothetical protein [Rhodospirillaceae bacterium]
MTSKEEFARLSDSDPRDAWRDEARDFTPWLVENIDYLSEALGLELEAISSEVAVDSFSADIVATVAGTNERVLIENQLENSDHRHLGQVLTYLAGLKAKTIVWIAPAFREAHRSAIGWLNENTVDDFAFFAVRLRVVRIGDSPFAPVFEVVEKPNAWERRLGQRANAAESELSLLRQRFWDRYLKKHPGTFEPARVSNVWLPMLSDGSVILSMYVASKTSGMFVRGPRGTDGKALARFMDRHVAAFERVFGASQSSRGGHYFLTHIGIPIREEERWDELIDWMHAQHQCYVEVFREIAALEED